MSDGEIKDCFRVLVEEGKKTNALLEKLISLFLKYDLDYNKGVFEAEEKKQGL